MSATRHVFRGLLLVLAITVSACTALRGGPFPSSSPLFASNGREAAHYQALAHEQDQLLATCADTHTCDRTHYTRALLALYENQAVAAKHFQDVIDAAPKSRLASSSQFWLQFLQDPPTFFVRGSSFAKATERLVHDLLELETTSALVLQREVLALQREVKVRDKKVEELTSQLEALKRIDQEMKEITRPTRPPPKPVPPADKGSQP